jgi:hypothetical protein
MPNWCNNWMTIKHSDPKMIQTLVEGYERDELFECLYPVATEAEHLAALETADAGQVFLWGSVFDPASIIDRAAYGWGTKWDTGKTHGVEPKVNKDGKGVRFSCYTAWTPPIGVYKHWVSLGFKINARYNETGMQLQGNWSDAEVQA